MNISNCSNNQNVLPKRHWKRCVNVSFTHSNISWLKPSWMSMDNPRFWESRQPKSTKNCQSHHLWMWLGKSPMTKTTWAPKWQRAYTNCLKATKRQSRSVLNRTNPKPLAAKTRMRKVQSHLTQAKATPIRNWNNKHNNKSKRNRVEHSKIILN